MHIIGYDSTFLCYIKNLVSIYESLNQTIKNFLMLCLSFYYPFYLW